MIPPLRGFDKLTRVIVSVHGKQAGSGPKDRDSQDPEK